MGKGPEKEGGGRRKGRGPEASPPSPSPHLAFSSAPPWRARGHLLVNTAACVMKKTELEKLQNRLQSRHLLVHAAAGAGSQRRSCSALASQGPLLFTSERPSPRPASSGPPLASQACPRDGRYGAS